MSNDDIGDGLRQEIVLLLQRLQPRLGRTSYIIRVALLKDAIRKYEEHAPDTPIQTFLMALHDALAGEWPDDYQVEHWREALRLTEKIMADTVLDEGRAERYVSLLDDAGFETLPFEIDFTELDKDR